MKKGEELTEYTILIGWKRRATVTFEWTNQVNGKFRALMD